MSLLIPTPSIIIFFGEPNPSRAVLAGCLQYARADDNPCGRRISHWFNGLRSPRWVSGLVLHLPMGGVVVLIENHTSARNKKWTGGVVAWIHLSSRTYKSFVCLVPAKRPTAKKEPHQMRISRKIREARLDNEQSITIPVLLVTRLCWASLSYSLSCACCRLLILLLSSRSKDCHGGVVV